MSTTTKKLLLIKYSALICLFAFTFIMVSLISTSTLPNYLSNDLSMESISTDVQLYSNIVSLPSTSPSIPPTNMLSASPTTKPSTSPTISPITIKYISNNSLAVLEKQHTLDKLSKTISSKNWSIFNNDLTVNNYTFSRFSQSLLISSVSNNNILLFGDSTMKKPAIFYLFCLHQALNITADYQYKCPFGSSLLFDFKDVELKNSNNKYSHGAKWIESNLPQINSKVFVASVGAGSGWRLNKIYLANIKNIWKPNIIVFNPSNLHLLHLIPVRYFEENAILLIKNFKKDLRHIYELGVSLQSCIIFRSASPFCPQLDSEWANGIYKEYHKFYTNKSIEYQNGINECKQKYHNQVEINMIDQVCENWTFNNHGVQFSNNLIKEFVTEIQTSKNKNDSYKKVFYYDRYNLMHHDDRCINESHDTIHWGFSYGADGMFFANFIQYVC